MPGKRDVGGRLVGAGGDEGEMMKMPLAKSDGFGGNFAAPPLVKTTSSQQLAADSEYYSQIFNSGLLRVDTLIEVQ